MFVAMDGIAPQIALLRQMYMGLDKKSRKAFLASIGHKDSHEERPAGNSTIDAFLHEKLGCHIACPDCKSETVVKWSVRKDGTRRYKCKACGRTFVLARNTVFYHAKIGLDIIRKYVEGMKEKDVLRLAAEKCGIGLKTSFFWRHKILYSLRGVMDGVRLNGIVESDETFFAISYKGARALPRDAHDRGVPAPNPDVIHTSPMPSPGDFALSVPCRRFLRISGVCPCFLKAFFFFSV